MNSLDILKYGHITLLRSVEGFPDSAWEQGGACGVWSSKDIIAHLASYEHLLIDIFNSVLHSGITPTLNELFAAGFDGFNDAQVERYRAKSVAETLQAYVDGYEQAGALAAQVPLETWRTNGVLGWYGAEYDLEDYIVYTFYGHKREHSAQINMFRDNLK